MQGSFRRLAVVALAALLASPASAQQKTAQCLTLEQCIAEVRDPAIRVNGTDIPAKQRITAFGDDAVVALLPLLVDPDGRIREDAGYLLHSFRDIDPRHYAALLAGWNYGSGRRNGWLIVPIATTRTDAALELLWADFERDPGTGSNSQIFFALPFFGPERLQPLLLDRIERCRRSADGTPCDGILALFDAMEDPLLANRRTPTIGLFGDAMADLAANGATDKARYTAETYLLARQHPMGLALRIARLDALDVEALARDEEAFAPIYPITEISRFGEQARSAGPSIARFLDPRLDPEVRAAAALALGRIGAADQASALVAQEPGLRDDWLLAYNTAEALGRLQAAEARPLLERLAASHWHRGVRNNARRGLNALSGSVFGLPESEPQGPVVPDEDVLRFLSDVRWAGDDADQRCRIAGKDVTLRSDPAGRIRFPARGVSRIDFAPVSETRYRAVREHIPVEFVQGRVTAIYPHQRGDLIAFNGGEFGGGLVVLPENGQPRTIVNEQVDFLWEMEGKLYVAAGLSHLGLDQGNLHVVDLRSLAVERVIRLPASPYQLVLGADRTAIVTTGAGDLRIAEDGTPLDAAAGCD
jgi:hypothetical protein